MSYEGFIRCDINKLNFKKTVSYSLDHDVIISKRTGKAIALL